MAFQVLKYKHYTILGRKVISRKPMSGVKDGILPKVEDHLIQKRGNISIRCLVCSQTLHC